MLANLTIDDFLAHLNQTFQLALDDTSSLVLELVEANKLGRQPDEGRRHAFSIIFHGPAEPLLPQQIYRLNHAEMGSLDLFLVPLGPTRTGLRYEAVFT